MAGSSDSVSLPPSSLVFRASALTSFIGRAAEIAALGAALGEGAPLVTITGAPGVGKTRLGRQFLSEVLAREGAAVVSCDLTEAHGEADVLRVVAASLDLAAAVLEGAELGAAVVRELTRGAVRFLCLDGCDRSLAVLGRIVASWISTGAVRVLATSCAALGVPEEVVCELGPLIEAEELFLERARAVASEYAHTPADRSLVSEIVRRLDGLPLAIELAAMRARLLSPSELLGRLERPFEVLVTTRRGYPTRHATMRAALAWSWSGLSGVERATLAVLSVFRSAFPLGAAEAVIGSALGADTPPVAVLLRSLRRRSLLTGGGAPPSRWSLPRLVRTFATEQLPATAAAAAVEGHTRFYLEHARRMEHPAGGCEVDPAAGSFAADHDDLRAVLERQAARGPVGAEAAVRAAVVLDALSVWDGISREEAALLDGALGAAPLASALFARGRLALARARASSGSLDEAEKICRDTLAVALLRRDSRIEGAARLRLATVLDGLARPDEALLQTDEALLLFGAIGDTWSEAGALAVRAGALLSAGRTTDALLAAENAEVCARAQAHNVARGTALGVVALVALERGDATEATGLFHRALRVATAVRARRVVARLSAGLALAALKAGLPEDVPEIVAASVADARVAQDPSLEGLLLAVAGGALAARGLVGAARESLGRAEALLEACPAWQELALVGRGYLDLACACAAEAEGDRADGALLRATVGARLATWRSPRSPEGRIAYRGLERLAGSRESVAAEGGGGRGTTLTLAPSATWFEVDDGVRVDLSRHSAPRRILDLLSSHQERERGQPLSIEALVGGAWPGERISGPVALNRLRVAISTLRSFGLRDLVVRHGPGYLLAPAVLVMRRAD